MTSPIRPSAIALACLLPAAAGAAEELPPLGQVERVWEGLIDTALAYEIGERCEDIDSRKLQGLAFLLSLQAHARSLGYSADQIEAFIDDEAEKDRLEAEARARLRDMGGVDGDWETYCEVGRREIAAETQVGRLLSD